MKKYREYYELLFSSYPDVVTIQDFRKMLGGIAEGTARKLLRENHIQHFYIHDTYLIPKVSVINYVLSKDYAEYRIKLKAQI